MPADLAHNPQPYRMRCPDKRQLRRLANKLRNSEEFSALVTESLAYILFLEERLMNVQALADAVTAKLKSIPTPPDPSRVLSDAAVASLEAMATAAGVDDNGVALPPPPPPAPVTDPNAAPQGQQQA